MSIADIKIYPLRAATLQQIKAAASQGYTRYVCGEISIEKSVRLVGKFDDMFCVTADRNVRDYRKKKGQANAKLFMYRKANSTGFYWWLLVSPGALHPDVEEIWLDARKTRSRIQFGDQFVLRQATVAKQKRNQASKHGRKYNNAPWTWFLTDQAKESAQKQLRTAAARAAQGNTLHFKQALQMLETLPKRERGASDDIYQLTAYFKRRLRSEFGKNRKDRAAEYCDQCVVDTSGGKGRIEANWHSLSSLHQRYTEGREWWPNQSEPALQIRLSKWLAGEADW